MPIALVLGFVAGKGIRGFWAGFLIALVILDIAVAIVVFRASWEPVAGQVKCTEEFDSDEDFKLDEGADPEWTKL